MKMFEARHLVIDGRVQGVGFRHGMTCAARALGVSGWVRNRRDGCVEALIAGESTAIAALLAWVRRGPPGARIDHVAVEFAEAAEQAATPEFSRRADA